MLTFQISSMLSIQIPTLDFYSTITFYNTVLVLLYLFYFTKELIPHQTDDDNRHLIEILTNINQPQDGLK